MNDDKLIRIYDSPDLHIYERDNPQDERIAYTRCNIRFVWTHDWPWEKDQSSTCKKCFSSQSVTKE